MLPVDPAGSLFRFTPASWPNPNPKRPAKSPPAEIDLRIAADGSWHYNGSPIERPALVRLFSTILRKDPDRHVLATPVERVGIHVEDAPFLAVEMAVEGTGTVRQIAFRTNVDDLVPVGPDHPLRFERDRADGVKPTRLRAPSARRQSESPQLRASRER